jgi:hypothetical protein
METLETQNTKLEVQLKLVKDEQSKILHSYYDLEHKYKEIL